MRSLAFDTTGAQCAVALDIDGRTAASAVAVARHGHAELLAPMIADVLARGGVPARALDRLAVTRGPGGFTGVRVGLATARGLALATGAPVFGVTTFEALLLSLSAPGPLDHDCVVAVVDSRLALLFVQLFDGRLRPLGPGVACEPAALAAMLPAGTRPLLIGDAAVRAAEALADAGRPAAGVLSVLPDAAALARAAAHCPPAALGLPAPLYLAPPAVSLPAAAVSVAGQ